MGSRGVSTHRGDRTLAERVAQSAPEPILRAVWIRDQGRSVPGVLLAWEKRSGAWFGLCAWDAGRGQERTWVPANWLQPIQPR
jgi:hypothetical protein